jgi:amino acid permease
MEQQSVWELVQSHLKQPEYLHVLLNPLPVYGLALGALALILAMAMRRRAAVIVALALIFISALSAWPTIHYGELGYDRALTLNETSADWLDAHAQRATRAEPAFYVLATIAAVAFALPWKLPKTATALNFITLAATLAVLALGVWIAYAGGQIRHREFRGYGSPPDPRGGYEKMRD